MRILNKQIWRLRRKFNASPIKFTFLAIPPVICLLAFLSYMGVFTHFLEKDYFNEFSYPLDVDLQPLVKDLVVGHPPSTKPINLFNYTYLKSCEDKCSNNGSPKLLFLVKSAIPNFEQREAIRQTWGNQMRFPDVEIRRVFLLGTGFDREVQRRVDQEYIIYGDIVQTDFHDDYRNNTLKTVSGFKWAVEHCPSVQYVVFSDDDMYLSTKNVLRFVNNPSNYPDQVSAPIVKDVEHRERSLKQEMAPATENIGNLNGELEDKKLYAGIRRFVLIETISRF